jgi:hypothetical protein
VYTVHSEPTLGVRRTLVKTQTPPPSEEASIATKTDVKARRREPLSRERVLRAAVALADASGVDVLSMRNLAHELGVVPMALYKHVAN